MPKFLSAEDETRVFVFDCLESEIRLDEADLRVRAWPLSSTHLAF